MWDRARELAADWLMLMGGAALLASLFLVWTHQFPPSLPSAPGLTVALGGVPRDPTGWQVYSIADVLLAVLAGALMAVALRGGPRARAATVVPAAIGLAFAVHAAGSPPTNGLDVLNPAASGRGYIDGAYASVGTGETVAVVGIAVALAGAVLGLWPRRR